MKEIIIDNAEESDPTKAKLANMLSQAERERTRQDRAEKPEIIQGIFARISVLVESISAMPRLTIGPELAFVRAVYRTKIEFGKRDSLGQANISFPLADYFEIDSLRILLGLLQTPPESQDFEGVEWLRYSRDLASTTREQLSEAYEVVRAKGNLADEHARPLIRGFLEEDGMREILNRAGEIREKIEEKLHQADAAVKGIAEVAGVAAEGELSRHFAAYAAAERKTANIARLSVVTLAVATAVFAFIAIGVSGRDLTWLELTRKFAITLPIVALAAYLARESSRHRESCDWAETIAVQLKTVRAYTESITEDARDSIRVELGKRIFSSQPPQSSNKQISHEEAIPTLSDLRTLISLDPKK
jgi:hypothetical protein